MASKRIQFRPLICLLMNSGQIGRQLHNRTSPKQTATATESTQATTSGPYPGRWQSMNGGLTELDDQLQQVKVFAEEQIIQFTFKSGKSVNYTMFWLRHLCSCPDCMSGKFNQAMTINTNTNTAVDENSLNVAQIRCYADSSEFEIEWLDDEYRRHTSIYNIKHLNLHYGMIK
ncbi:hypothetical protein DERF_004206 [Dermatophagoides farinae]|uniref:Gamma-butyrobetaine hydroxylase-like N-terminal domain-containing protein n=1 Tax=Dermatophagoides farinae TaxID=6954 RepID=A0A922I2Q9_DERFA|nr:hypothetical protein DERF_004206 [Dermatophagoides farinae]